MPIFKDRDSLLRAIQGVYDAEKINRSEIFDQLPGYGAGQASGYNIDIEITGSKIATNTPPFDGGVTEIDFYPGKFVFRNIESFSPAEDWNDLGAPDGICLVQDINGEDLEVGKKYSGRVVGTRNEKPIVLTNISEGGAVASGGGIFGQPYSTPGSFMIWEGETGQWAAEAKGLRYFYSTQTNGRPTVWSVFSLPGTTTVTPDAPSAAINPAVALIQSEFPTLTLLTLPTASLSISYNWFTAVSHYGASFDRVEEGSFFNDGLLVYHRQLFRFNANAQNATIVTVADPGANKVIRFHETGGTFEYWMAHYASDGTAGVTSGSTFKQGLKVGEEAAIADLGGGATLADVITKVNDILAKLRLAGIIDT